MKPEYSYPSPEQSSGSCSLISRLETPLQSFVRICSGRILAWLILWAGFNSELRADSSIFGSDKLEKDGLIGILYDLKQTQLRKPTDVGNEEYWSILDGFLSNGWDEGALSRYFRATRALFATQLFIPEMDAGQAPHAFGVEKVVGPSKWIIHYKGQVAPPRSGVFRFVGYCDDVMAIAVNNQTVLVNGWSGPEHLQRVLKKTAWDDTGRQGRQAVTGKVTHGDWLELKADEAIDLDIVIGEVPGGAFCAFLFIEEKGREYEMQDGDPLLPMFQLAPNPTPPSGKFPTFSKTPDLWKLVR
jgi:hypothetical protein